MSADRPAAPGAPPSPLIQNASLYDGIVSLCMGGLADHQQWVEQYKDLGDPDTPDLARERVVRLILGIATENRRDDLLKCLHSPSAAYRNVVLDDARNATCHHCRDGIVVERTGLGDFHKAAHLTGWAGLCAASGITDLMRALPREETTE